jgi:hypothetical protein
MCCLLTTLKDVTLRPEICLTGWYSVRARPFRSEDTLNVSCPGHQKS